MELTIKVGKKDLPRLIVMGIILVVGIIFSWSRLPDAIIWYAGLFLLSFLTVKGKGKLQIILDIILPVLSAAFSIYFMQYINLVDHNKVLDFDTKFLYEIMYHIEKFRWVYEMPIIIGFYFFLRLFTIPRRFAAMFTPLPFLLVGLIDYYVYMFRGHEVLVSDIYSIGTAMNVVGTYKFPLLFPLVFVILPFVMWIIVCWRIKEEKPLLPWYIRIAVNAVISALFFGSFVVLLKDWSKTNSPWGWADKGSAFNGLMMNIALSANSMFPEAPEGYKSNSLDELMNQYNIDINDEGNADDAANIIVVMNESYMQLRDYLPMLTVFEDPAPFWNSLQENTIHGYATSSVYGANTPNSEFELLTSISMANMPTGSVPYTMFIKHDMYSWAWAMRNLGYTTTAMHPYEASGWRRPVVWPNLGFEKTMFVDDFEHTDADLYREYISDMCAYKNLINQLESAPEGQKTFTFLVTMQNHGGYGNEYENFPVPQRVKKVFSGEVVQVNTYIELVKQSDNALEMLVNYLKEQDEKYVLVVFGDHQPSIDAFTNNMAPGKNTSWAVPYIVWTNYDMDPEVYNIQETRSTDASSINYLSIMAMKAAGVKLPAYYQLVDKIQEEIPSINAIGFYSNETNSFDYLEKASTPKDIEAMRIHRFLQYSIMFDNSKGDFEKNLYGIIDKNK